MRIILVETEIKAAITAFVLQQIAVKDGQEVTIDFKNTRGEDGATAEINIGLPTTPSTPKPAPAAKVAQQERSTAPASTSTPETAPAADEAPVDPEQVEELQQAQSEPELEAPADTSTPTPVMPAGGGAPQEEEGTKEEAPAPATKPATPAQTETPAPAAGKSLFANLTKPVHDTPAS